MGLPIGVEPSRSRRRARGQRYLTFRGDLGALNGLVITGVTIAACYVSLYFKKRCGLTRCGHNLAEDGTHDTVFIFHLQT